MKTAPQHTPGPWNVEPLQWDHGASIAIVAGRQIICTIAPENEDDEPDMSTAQRGPDDELNAQLIATAPELLAALEFQTEAAQAVIFCWERGDLAAAVRALDLSISSARAAIARSRKIS